MRARLCRHTAHPHYKGSDAGLKAVQAWAKQEIALKKGRIDQIAAVSPFLPRYEAKDSYIADADLNIAAIAHYLQALDIRMKAHKMVTVFGGRAPHLIGLVPGGLTQVPTRANIREYKKYLDEVEKFVNDVYIGVIAGARYTAYFPTGTIRHPSSYAFSNLRTGPPSCSSRSAFGRAGRKARPP